MKKLHSVILIGALLVSGSASMYAQISKEQKKERQEVLKSSKKEVESKATKVARKEAKQLKKEGWKVTPGALPLEKQLDKSYLMQYEYDDNLMPKYMMGEAMSTGGSYDAARMQAAELAKQNLAGQIQTEVTALIENTVANEQLDKGVAESIVRSIMASKNLISQSIGKTMTVVEAYRMKPNGNTEVLIRLAYNSDAALEVAKKVVREDLEKKGDDLHGKLDKLLGW